MAIANDITDLIGGTPLTRLSRFAAGAGGTVLGKCEFMNPYSVKDRAVLSMIREAERSGDLEPGGTIVEAGAEVDWLEPGTPVAMNPNLACHQCRQCLRDRPHLCEHPQAVGVTRNGGFAELVAMPA